MSEPSIPEPRTGPNPAGAADPDLRPPANPVSRRLFLGGGAAALGLALVGCSSSDDSAATTTTIATTTSSTLADTEPTGPDGDDVDDPAGGDPTDVDDGSTVFEPADFDDLGVCRAMPEQMAGPFPSPELLLRRDITEDRSGVPLRVGAQVVDDACEPIPDAVLEIWHCDVDGDYSAYIDGENEDEAGPGTMFLRGYQVTDENGIVEFHTIFPGWYTGRAVHIHARVHLDDELVHTSQWYFEGDVCDAVFEDDRYDGPADTTNAEDGIAADDPWEDGTMMTVSEDADIGDGGLRALIRVGLPA